MFHFRNFLHISAKLYKQSVVQQIFGHPQHIGLFCTSATLPTILTRYENQFAHRVLEANPKCRVLRGEHNRHTDAVSAQIAWDQNWSELPTSGIVECLEKVGIFCKESGRTISDEIFDKFVDACTERCFDFTDDQLIQSLQILTRHPHADSTRSRNFMELWNAFDDACVERIATWDVDTILYVCDHWQTLFLGRINKFCFGGCLKAGKKLRKLPPHQLVQLTFYLSIRRVPILDMFEIEINLANSFDNYSIDEIAVVCLSFFKTQTKFKNQELIEKIYKRTIGEIQTVEGLSLTCILKALRHCAYNGHAGLVRKMLDAVNDQLPRLSTLSCLHVALLGTHLHICHQNCIEQILHRFSQDVKSIRMKDLERISYVMGFFDFQSESKIETRLCEQFLNELRNRVDDIVKHPKCFSLCLHFLTLKGYYDEEMISVALSPQFLKATYESQHYYDHEIFGLDSYAKINLKETYTGNALTEKNRQYLGKMLTDYIPDRNKEFKIGFTDEILLEVKETSDKLFAHCYFAHALPHFNKPDVIIAYDKSAGTGIDIAHNLPPIYTGKIIDRSMVLKGLDTTNVEIFNIIVGGWAHYNRDTDKMNGLTMQKIEQSKILGLRPVVIPWFEWNRLHMDERELYIKVKFNEALQEKHFVV